MDMIDGLTKKITHVRYVEIKNAQLEYLDRNWRGLAKFG